MKSDEVVAMVSTVLVPICREIFIIVCKNRNTTATARDFPCLQNQEMRNTLFRSYVGDAAVLERV